MLPGVLVGRELHGRNKSDCVAARNRGQPTAWTGCGVVLCIRRNQVVAGNLPVRTADLVVVSIDCLSEQEAGERVGSALGTLDDS